MTLTDIQHKALLDAQAVARHVQNTQVMARASALACANQIEELIDRCERIDREATKDALVAPF